jgi:hypothetical protein
LDPMTSGVGVSLLDSCLLVITMYSLIIVHLQLMFVHPSVDKRHT